MFRKLIAGSGASDAQAFVSQDAHVDELGQEIQAHLARLRSLPRDQLADAVFLLSMAARQQSEGLRQAIEANTGHLADPGSPPTADLADFLAAQSAATLRHHEMSPPRLVDVLLERSPEARFTVQQGDAVALLAAMFREQRIEGILEGLRLAGVLNEPAKTRHAGIAAGAERVG